MKHSRATSPPLFFACLVFATSLQPTDDTPEVTLSTSTSVVAEVATAQAAIAIPEPFAAEITAQILQNGGNAVDAAVATGFALAVTYIDAGNIGGGGFMLIHMDGESSFLDYREMAPLAAHRDM